ncbi:DUF3427 domain-containing protein [Psychromicrobium xiongbiense]|uniref:DUF3427 domain-containing protein n=1 Tax=Psychromicrobium xiongbiense TaxID=3051184 RepID=UPI0025522ADA|nr:DUF3427 domain-containing protein [Psychromicrobium sp. YIM S02556]
MRFDRISQERVLQSIVDTTLDKIQNIKAAFDALRNRLGRTPSLLDFYRFESVDPVLLATKYENYQTLVAKLTKVPSSLSHVQDRLLALLSCEVLPAKRLHEVVLLKSLLVHGRLSYEEIRRLFEETGLKHDDLHVGSSIRTLTLSFNTEAEQKKYVYPAAHVRGEQVVELTAEFGDNYRDSAAFSSAVDDLLNTAQALISDRYTEGQPFVVGKQYSRKDACRLLCWPKNITSTIYGYKVDALTASCPIFVTYHKSGEITASTDYGDELLDPSTMHWFTRSRRKLTSGEVVPIVANSVALHVFVKKDDNEGSDFFYLGRALSEDAVESTMPNDVSLSVVQMNLRFESPVPSGIYDYFNPSIAQV